jgi:hypothetical protein
MEPMGKSAGSEQMKKIQIAYNAYAASVRISERHLARLHKLIKQFPKNEVALHEEKIERYLKMIKK